MVVTGGLPDTEGLMTQIYMTAGLAAATAGLLIYTAYVTFNATIEALQIVAIMAAL